MAISRSLDTPMRYRGSALAELFRALRTLQALQAEARAIAAPQRDHAPSQQPNEPEGRTHPGWASP